MNRGDFNTYGAIGNDGGGYQGRGYNAPYRDDGGHQIDIVDLVSSNIFKVNSNASALDKTIRQIGTSSDSGALREKIHHTQQVTNGIVKKTSGLLKTLAAASRRESKQQKLQVDRLRSDFSGAVKEYSMTQKKVAEKLKTYPEPPSAVRSPPDGYGETGGYDPYSDDRTPFMEDERKREELAQLQEQEQVIEFDQALMEEREEKIRQIEADILDVNQIFRDLASLVYEQGDMVDTIEANVEKAYGNVESGNEQLAQASRYQKKARKKMCIILVILVVVGAVIGLIIYLSVRK